MPLLLLLACATPRLAAPPVAALPEEPCRDGRPLAAVLRDWPEVSREAAEDVLVQHGPPDEATPSRLVWYDTAPWVRTVVHREPLTHYFPVRHADVVEQVALLRVPPGRLDDLAALDGSITVHRTAGEVSVRSAGQAMNFLAVNLAHDVIAGERTVAEARAFFANAWLALVEDGHVTPYVEMFVFPVPSRRFADPDEPATH